MKQLLVYALLLLSTNGYAQPLTDDMPRIQAVVDKMQPAIDAYNKCLVTSEAATCARELAGKAHSNYEKFVVANVLYSTDTALSLQLHSEAHEELPTSRDTTLEYAASLHRRGDYKAAAALYEQYAAVVPDDYRVNTWLAECYMNLGDTARSIACWKLAGHKEHHTSIDQAIYTIHGSAEQVRTRSNYRKTVKSGNTAPLPALIYLDANWETDWWNTDVNTQYLQEDLKLLKNDDKNYNTIMAYTKIKQLHQSNLFADSVRDILLQYQLLTGNNALPTYGPMTEGLLQICFVSKVMPEDECYLKRGPELLKAATDNKDKNLLNVYAYLQAEIKGKVAPEIDLMGWHQLHDERFAISYLAGKGDAVTYDDAELTSALHEFPNSALLHWFSLRCAVNAHVPVRPMLAAQITKEFKTLGSDREHFSDQLDNYYHYLESMK